MIDHREALAILAGAWLTFCCAAVRADDSSSFETDGRGAPPSGTPIVAPWQTISLDAEYGGYWVVAGDVDGDGQIEFVSARNHNRNDDHFTSSVSVQKLDGSILWRWGDPKLGRRELHHDVACQIHDLDNDGIHEVILAGDRQLIILDGCTGEPAWGTNALSVIGLSRLALRSSTLNSSTSAI